MLSLYCVKHCFIYVLDTPHMFGCPLYVLMAKHAFFVLCVTLLTTLFILLQCPIYCPKSLTVLQLYLQPKLLYI